MRPLSLAVILLVFCRSAGSLGSEGGGEDEGKCRPGEVCNALELRFKWMDKDHLCRAQDERAPRVIEAHKDVSMSFREYFKFREGGDDLADAQERDRAIGLLQDIIRLTYDLQRCNAEIFREKGVKDVDWNMLRDPAGWWNSILAHALNLEEAKAFYSALDSTGWAAMHLAVRLNIQFAIDSLAKRGADINVAASQENCLWRPLHVCASIGGEGGCALRLHEHGADLAARDCRGEMPEEVAARSGHKELAWSIRTWRACSNPSNMEDCLTHPPTT